ncbi:MAG: hypothetical protein AAFP76_08760 [Bacteroidota bacterium]
MKYLLAIPIFLFLAQLVTAQVAPNRANVPFHQVETPPLYSGCEDLEIAEGKRCTQEKIHSFLLSNFNKSVLSKRDRKVGITFTISEEGKVMNIKPSIPSQHLENEIKRITSLLPSFTPGEHRGEKRPVHYGTILDFTVYLKNLQSERRPKKS